MEPEACNTESVDEEGAQEDYRAVLLPQFFSTMAAKLMIHIVASPGGGKFWSRFAWILLGVREIWSVDSQENH